IRAPVLSGAARYGRSNGNAERGRVRQRPFATPDVRLAKDEALMGRYILRRLLVSLPALLGVLFACFLLLQVVPTDPAAVIAGPDANAETIAAIRDELGLDRPLLAQFWDYILRVGQGDLGRSIISNKQVVEELGATIGPTVELMVAAMVIAVPIGILHGKFAAVRRGRPTDRVIMAISVAGVSLPIFF